MSQPQDVQRSFLPFGNPFRLIFPKGFYLSPKLVSLLTTFEQSLAESLRKLKPKDISDIPSLSWLRCAMEALSETHINIKALITDLEFPVSDWEEKWIDVYLDNSVKLLDICIALSSELSRLDQGQVLLQYVIHILDSPGNLPSLEQLKHSNTTLSDWIQQINSSPMHERSSVVLEDLLRTLYSAKVKNSAKGKVLMRALFGVKVVTIFVCSVFISVLGDCSKPLTVLNVPNKFLWAEAFNDLQADVSKGITCQIPGKKVKELEVVIQCAERLCDLNESLGCMGKEVSSRSNGITPEKVILEISSSQEENRNWQESLSELAEGTKSLSHELDLLSKQVGDFFQIVLSGRDDLLCNLRVTDDVIMQRE